MLGHAGTGLWWAVKTSRRLRTRNVCACVCERVRGMWLCLKVCLCKYYKQCAHVVCVGACVCVLLGEQASLSTETDRSEILQCEKNTHTPHISNR